MNNNTTSTQTFKLTQAPQKTKKCKNSTYIKLKNDLVQICQKIEDSFNLIIVKSPHIKKEKEEISPQVKNESDDINQVINSYKSKTKDMELQLEAVYKMGRILEIERELLTKEKEYNQLKNENDTLNAIRVHHVKGLEEYQNKILKRNEVIALTEKIKKIKEETKIKRNYHRTTEAQIKGQINQIKVIETKINIIKENIEYKKMQQMKEIENNIKKSENENQNDDLKDENDPEKLSQIAKMNEENYYQFEFEYKKAIEEQRTKIERIKDEIKILTIKIQEIDQQRKIHELKKKETKKREEFIQMQKQQQHMNFKKNFNKIVHNINNSNSKSDKVNFSMKNKYNNKPFEINKLLNEQNSQNPLQNSSNKDVTLVQIEQLKSDIEKAINQNDQNFQIELDAPSQKLLNNLTDNNIKSYDAENDNNYEINLSNEIDADYDNV